MPEIRSAHANDNGRVACEFAAPIGGLLVVASDGAGNQPLVGGEILVGTHVDQHRRLRRADQADEFIR